MGYNMQKPNKLLGKDYSFDAFDNGKVASFFDVVDCIYSRIIVS